MSLIGVGALGDAEVMCLLAEFVRGFRGGTAHGLELLAELLKLAAAGHQPGEFLPGDLLLRVVADDSGRG